MLQAKLKAENVHLKRCHADLAASYESLDQNCETWVSQIHGSLLTAGGIGRRAFDMAIKVSKDIKQVISVEVPILLQKYIFPRAPPRCRPLSCLIPMLQVFNRKQERHRTVPPSHDVAVRQIHFFNQQPFPQLLRCCSCSLERIWITMSTTAKAI